MDDRKLIQDARALKLKPTHSSEAEATIEQLCDRLEHWMSVSTTISRNIQADKDKLERKEGTIWGLQGAMDDQNALHDFKVAELERVQKRVVQSYQDETDRAKNESRVLRHIIKQVKDRLPKDVRDYVDMMLGCLASGNAHISEGQE